MIDLNHDRLVRQAVFHWLTEQTQFHGNILLRSLLAQGMTNREIAQTLTLSERTVQRRIDDLTSLGLVEVETPATWNCPPDYRIDIARGQVRESARVEEQLVMQGMDPFAQVIRRDWGVTESHPVTQSHPIRSGALNDPDSDLEALNA